MDASTMETYQRAFRGASTDESLNDEAALAEARDTPKGIRMVLGNFALPEKRSYASAIGRLGSFPSLPSVMQILLLVDWQ